MKSKILPIAVVLLSMVSVISASNVSTFTSSKDNTIIQTTDGSMANSLNLIYVGNIAKSPSIRRGLVAFDLSSISTSTVIDSVKLVLSLSAATVNTIEVHKATTAWGEGTSNASGGAGVAATTGDVTWLHSVYNTVFWTTPGGDFDATVASSKTIAATDVSITFRGTELTANVAYWIANPTSNFGWLLKSNNESTASGNVEKINSKETASSDALKPTLYVYYSGTTSSISPKSTNISVYPTLVSTTLNVRSEETLKSVEIFDYTGKRMLQSTEKNINLNGLKSGIYFVRILTESNTLTERIIKQ